MKWVNISESIYSCLLLHSSEMTCIPLFRTLTLTLALHDVPDKYNLIQIYSHTTTHTDEGIEQNYESIDNKIKVTPKKEFVMLQGEDIHSMLYTNIECSVCAGRFGFVAKMKEGKD